MFPALPKVSARNNTDIYLRKAFLRLSNRSYCRTLETESERHSTCCDTLHISLFLNLFISVIVQIMD